MLPGQWICEGYISPVFASTHEAHYPLSQRWALCWVLCPVLQTRFGVLFFRNQDLTIEDQKLLGQKLGELTGKPETSKLHRHALANSKRGIAVDENGRLDDEVSVISSEQNRRFYADRYSHLSKKLASQGWHAEHVTRSLSTALFQAESDIMTG